MSKKHTSKAKILTAILVIVLGSAPAISHAGFFDWLGNYGDGYISYSNFTPSQANSLYATASDNQEEGEFNAWFPVFFQNNSLGQVSSVLTVNDSKTRQLYSRVTVSKGLASPVLTLEGEASYYSWAGCLGCNAQRIMANGQPLNDNALTMAIGADKKHLVGRVARVTSLETGKSVLALITDTGGFYKAKYGYRVADLTPATKQAIGMVGGVGQVRVEVF